MLALASEEALCALEFRHGRGTDRLSRTFGCAPRRWFAAGSTSKRLERGHRVSDATAYWLDGYFAGIIRHPATPLDMRGADVRAPRLAGVADDSRRRDNQLRRARQEAWVARRVTCRRPGQRRQPDRHHRALSSRDRIERDPDRIRRRPRQETVAARSRTALGTRAQLALELGPNSRTHCADEAFSLQPSALSRIGR